MSEFAQHLKNSDRRGVIAAANVIATGMTYCYLHGLTDGDECHPADLSSYVFRARTLLRLQT